jgi:DNA-directed RNA polymerase subunit H (RpoH/RPB5)
LEQLAEQGYETAHLTGFSIAEVSSMVTNNQTSFQVIHTDDSRKLKVIFEILKPFRLTKDQQPNIDDKDLTEKDTLYIVTLNKPNESVIRQFSKMKKYFIIINPLERLQYNVLKHTLVPKHIVLSDAEAAEVKKKYNIVSDSQFPTISRFDPIATVIGLRPGQICKIIRPSPTSLYATNYRICEA